MQRSIEIRIYNDSDVYEGFLELKEASDFPLQLTKSIANISDISQRKTTFSLDFEVPKTSNNNQLLTGIRFLNSIPDSKDVLFRKRARIFVNDNEEDRGFIRFSTSELKDTYTGTFFGGNGDWVDLMKNLNMNELDWENLGEPGVGEELFIGNRIDIVNQGTYTDYDLAYPYLDRNTGSATALIRPVFYVKKIFQRAFEKIGYSINSGGFLDSTFVIGDGGENKGLVIDPAVNFSVDESDIEATRSNYKTTRILSTDLDPNTWDNTYVIGNNTTPPVSTTPVTLTKLNNFFDTLIKDDAFIFDPATSTYTCQTTAYFNIEVDFPNKRAAWWDTNANIWGSYTPAARPLTRHEPSISVKIVKNNTSPTVIDGQIVFDLNRFNAVNVFEVKENVFFNAGDTVTVWFEMKDNALGFSTTGLNAPSLERWKITLGHNANINFSKAESIELGDKYDINGTIPDELKVFDLIQDCKVLFNLYFEADTRFKTIDIKTRDNYYQNIGTAENITNRIDLNSKITTNYRLPYTKQLSFAYNEDQNDGYLEEWQRLNKRTYGKYTHTFSDRFDNGETTISTNLISPTIQIVMVGNIVSSRIREYWDDAENQGKGINTKYKPRIYQLIRSIQTDTVGNPRRTQSPFTVSCGIMEEFGGTPTIDNKKLTFNGTNGLVDQFYAKTLANIEDAAIVTLKMDMSYFEFRKIDLSRPVYIDSIEELKGYYIYQSIKNFDVAKPGLTEVELIRFKNYQPITIDSSQATNINANTTTNQNNGNLKAIWFIDESTTPATYEQVFEEDSNGNFVPIYYI